MNYDLRMQEIIAYNKEKNMVPTLLLHCCCAPCSSAVLERLSNDFKITVFYYNPNISVASEYTKRIDELKRFVKLYPTKNKIDFIEGEYTPQKFYEIAKNHEQDKEGGERCYLCYEMRLRKTAKIAKQKGFDYFTTTLSISPHKNVVWLNEIGEKLAKEYQISYLYSDFKKKEGYKRSIILSKEYNLYRQDYCGCSYSKTGQKQNNVV